MSLLIKQLFLLGILQAVTGVQSVHSAGSPPALSPGHSLQVTSRIGILLPDRSEPQVIQAAGLAVDQANSRDSNRNQYELVVRTAGGPWGAGSKESVALVFEDSVDVIVGSLDGRNAHLAEQVSARSHLVYLETHATDPTLSQAFVPWFMRCVPGDDQQSHAILRQIENDGEARIAILSTADYDTRYSVQSLIKTMAGTMGVSPLVVQWEGEEPGSPPSVSQLKDHRITHLIVPFFTPSLPGWLSEARDLLPDLRIYGNLAFTMGLEREGMPDEPDGAVMVCSGSRFTLPGRQFRENFRAKYGSEPGIRCSYIYDAVSLVIHAMEQQGAERDTMKDIMAEINYQEGVTGTMSFDEWGNREQPVTMMTLRSGHLVLLENNTMKP